MSLKQWAKTTRVLIGLFVISSFAFGDQDESRRFVAENKAATEVAAEPDPASEKVPSVRIPEENFQFESIVEGQDVKHEFVVRNEGDAVLEIQKVRTG
jgi:hypothetical protein